MGSRLPLRTPGSEEETPGRGDVLGRAAAQMPTAPLTGAQTQATPQTCVAMQRRVARRAGPPRVNADGEVRAPALLC